jgi:hypothetical protein
VENHTIHMNANEHYIVETIDYEIVLLKPFDSVWNDLECRLVLTLIPFQLLLSVGFVHIDQLSSMNNSIQLYFYKFSKVTIQCKRVIQ